MSDANLQRRYQSVSDSAWNVDRVVSELLSLRDQSPFNRQREGSHDKLPSRKQLSEIVEKLGTVLFPVRLSTREFLYGNVNYYVGHTLDVTLGELAEELERELRFKSDEIQPIEDVRHQAVLIARSFAEKLPRIRSLLETDIQAAIDGDPAATSRDEVLACYPGIAAILHYRIAHTLYRLGAPLVARIISEIAHSQTGIEIHPGALIQGHFFIDHGTGVVIGETAEIGEHVRLYQAVTLGAKRHPTDSREVIDFDTPRHPIVEDNVVIYAGATILGRLTIGRGSVIGGNVWLTTSVPAGSHITQAKASNEIFGEGAGI